MWYIFGSGWKIYPNQLSPDRLYKIAFATSPDGFNWNRNGEQIIVDKLKEDECQALPTVIYYDNTYHMFFCYRHASGFRDKKERGYKIGYAFSKDLLTWTRDDERGGLHLSESGWDSEMMCYPHVFVWRGQMWLLYNGNQFGRYGFGIASLQSI